MTERLARKPARTAARWITVQNEMTKRMILRQLGVSRSGCV